MNSKHERSLVTMLGVCGEYKDFFFDGVESTKDNNTR